MQTPHFNRPTDMLVNSIFDSNPHLSQVVREILVPIL